MRLLALVGGAPALLLRQDPAPAPTESPQAEPDHQSCLAMVGSYEGHTTRVSVFLPHVFLSSPSQQHHAQGNITSSTPCACSGVLKFGEGIPYMYRYDLWTCALTWSTAPQVGSPMATPANVWTRDGVCEGPVVCDPERIDESLQSLTMVQASDSIKLAKAAAEAALPLAQKVEAAAKEFLATGLPNIRARRALRDSERAVKSCEDALAAADAGTALSMPNTTDQPPPQAAGAPNDPVPPSELPTETMAASVPETQTVTPAPPLTTVPPVSAGPVLVQKRRTFGGAASQQKLWVSTGSGCAAMAGEFEGDSTTLEVYNGTVYAMAGDKSPHASGEITSETDCTCSGELDFGELGVYEFKYDLLACALTWYEPPSLEVPHSVESNRWNKDGPCVTAAQCAPRDDRPRQLKVVNTREVALKAEVAAIKTATALTLVAVAAQALVAEVIIENEKHPQHKDALTKVANDVSELPAAIMAPARQAFQCLVSLNPRAVQPARTAIQTATQMMEVVKKQMLLLK
mmetsp:Transcript_8979/g.21355  ORF Transcript_8979/g.21355 Transcript_8979/m.21355 type:complete len:517 (+) Transcript_8979:87-1637(+)